MFFNLFFHSSEVNFSILNLILFCFLLFSAGFVDSIGGGGGLLSIPGYLMTGLPTHTIFGTNKFSSSIGTFVSLTKFFKHNKIHLKLLKFLAPMSFLGAISGVLLLQFIKPDFLKFIIPFLIITVGIYTLANKSLGNVSNYSHPNKHALIKGMVFTFFIGFYDGIFGPGTGSFFILMLIKIFHLDFIEASGNTKMLNLISNLASLFMFIIYGQVFFPLALIGAFFNVIGAYIGSHLAITKGTSFIKPVFISISFIIATKMIIEQFLL